VLTEKPSKPETHLHWPTIVLWSIVVTLVAAFILQNTRTGKIDFLAWDIRAPAWVWLLGVFLCGFLTGWLVPSLRRSRAASSRKEAPSAAPPS